MRYVGRGGGCRSAMVEGRETDVFTEKLLTTSSREKPESLKDAAFAGVRSEDHGWPVHHDDGNLMTMPRPPMSFFF